jgi:hypothetical protein
MKGQRDAGKMILRLVQALGSPICNGKEKKKYPVYKISKPGTMPRSTVSETRGDLLDFSEVSSGDTKP